MPFQPGHPKHGGRKVGTPNQFTAKLKEAMEFAFEEMGGQDGFLQWARREPRAFYQIIMRSMPKDVRVSAEDGGPIRIILHTGNPEKGKPDAKV